MDGFHPQYQSFHSFSQEEVGMLHIVRNIVIKQTMAKIELWDDRYDADKELLVDDFMNKFDYKLTSVQHEDYFHMYKSKVI